MAGNHEDLPASMGRIYPNGVIQKGGEVLHYQNRFRPVCKKEKTNCIRMINR
jgi:hypothetical protein